MELEDSFTSDVAFTPAVKELQRRRGSRSAYAQRERAGAWAQDITPALQAELQAQVSVFLATASAQGQPYIQHRGGPAGFLQVLDVRTIAFAEFPGNRQYITQGNLAENAQAQLFLMDYARRRRIKIWGSARVVEDDVGLLARVLPPGHRTAAAQIIVFTVHAWDANCPKHIPQRWEAADVEAALAVRDERIPGLEARLRELRDQASP